MDFEYVDSLLSQWIDYIFTACGDSHESYHAPKEKVIATYEVDGIQYEVLDTAERM